MYDRVIDKKWQDKWYQSDYFNAKDDFNKEKFYGLVEFPYPSGVGLHIGHIKAYIGLEVIARMKRLQGYNVLFPMGFDAFGLPTENYAIKTGIHPRVITDDNIKKFTEQLKNVGFSFDFSRVIDTTDPNYYKWTQWIFLKLFEHGLAYKDKTQVNYCNNCKVVLSNEESQGGKCDRCDGEVVQLEKEVWMLKITDYADKLLEGLNEVDFPERVKVQQENWIGKSTGAEVEFKIKDTDDTLKIYTTRPDTMYGVTFMVVAPEHPMIDKYKDRISNMDEIEAYKVEAKKKTEFERVQLAKDKTGVEIKGIRAINPVNGKEVPIWISDYVMMGYGTGAIMAVPAHDTRDYEFAKKFGIDIIQVIEGGDISKEAYTDISDGIMINSAFLNGLKVKDAIEKMIEAVEVHKVGHAKTNYFMKDWAFARQRYWGEPVPIVKCPHCGLVPVPENELPVRLPEVKDFKPGQNGESPLADAEWWVNTKCPKCGGEAKRETDTMPQWAGSSWYFLRYIDPNNDLSLASLDKLKYWLPVDWYNGGMEHVTRHLIYSRFWHRFLYDIGVVPTKEPYKKRSTQGLILGSDGEKMSKSRGNVINPDDIVKEYGADTLRTYMLFIGEYDEAAPWNDNGVKGVKKFLDRVIRLESIVVDNYEKADKDFERELNKTIKKVTEDYLAMKFNTAVAQMMTLVNLIYKKGEISKEDLKKFLIILNPAAPHVTEELWSRCIDKDSMIVKESWPTHDDSKLKEDTVEIAVQICGKVRFTVVHKTDATVEEVTKLVMEDERLGRYTEGKEIKKSIIIPGKIANIVV